MRSLEFWTVRASQMEALRLWFRPRPKTFGLYALTRQLSTPV